MPQKFTIYHYVIFNLIKSLLLYIYTPVGVEHLIMLLTPQCFQISLTLRMIPVWNFVVGIFARKALHNMPRVLSSKNKSKSNYNFLDLDIKLCEVTIPIKEELNNLTI